jgi:succinate-semialdehyde dehydrogenase/glutarate-semialdehyde dehydrogenase
MSSEAQIAVRRIESRNPATGEVLAEFDCATPEQVNEAVERARMAQRAWAAAGIRDRLAVIQRFQSVLQANKEDVARTITQEAGKPYAEALLTEVMVTLDAARFVCETAYSFLEPERVPHGSLAMKLKSGRLLREPWGVIGIISPWNYPFSIPSVEVVAALAMGNAVVLKPSELTPLSVLQLQSLFEKAGLPADLLKVVVGDGATGAALCAAAIDKLMFTGSVPTGKRVAELAASLLIPVVLELGGKDPMLVLDDADLDMASSGAVYGAFVNAGQTCLSVERCYVHRSLYDRFVGKCVEKARQLCVGNGMVPETHIGPLIHERQVRIVEQQVEDARARGARVLLGGERLPDLGPNFYAPTILADVDQAMRVMQEETFGPVLPIAPFETDDDAVRLANDSEFGLAASVWTKSRRRGEALARRLETGTVMVNDVVSCFAISEAPHGGIKSSGAGRTHGRIGLEEMVRPKYLDVDLVPRIRKPWWYGFGGDLGRGADSLIDFLFARNWARRARGIPGVLWMAWRKKL